MQRYILTGTPGSGKTSLLHSLEMQGFTVVNEAATDIIAYEQAQNILEPWKDPSFIEKILTLQKHRESLMAQVSSPTSAVQFYDRSAVCTYALSLYLGFKPSLNLLKSLDELVKGCFFERRVFFIKNLGFCAPSEARKISFEEALAFEKIHLEVYSRLGFECCMIPAAPLEERTSEILKSI